MRGVRGSSPADQDGAGPVSRLRIYLEPRDCWVGVYVAPKAVYVCLVPFVVIRWSRCS